MSQVPYVLETRDLSKVYHGSEILKQVSVKLERGHIYGFVGNNGAGKTTFMRLVAGLAKPSGGSLFLFGENNGHKLEQGRKRTGFLIETPSFYPDLSAKQNLLIQAKLKGVAEKEHVEKLLEMVGLADTGRKTVKNFSAGMRQRYGLAFAMVGFPEFLVLDEPLNGLDVESMDELTELLRQLCETQLTTLLISSHLLARLSALATDYIFLNYGKVIQTITAKELKIASQNKDLEEYFRCLTRSAL